MVPQTRNGPSNPKCSCKPDMVRLGVSSLAPVGRQTQHAALCHLFIMGCAGSKAADDDAVLTGLGPGAEGAGAPDPP